MKKILIIIVFGFIVLNITGCKGNNVENTKEEEIANEYKYIIELNDNRKIYSTINIKYNNEHLFQELSNNEITIDEFFNNLTYFSGLNDGGSKLYKYNKENNIYGDKDFYVINCNSYLGIKDIFIDSNYKTLVNECIKERKA